MVFQINPAVWRPLQDLSLQCWRLEDFDVGRVLGTGSFGRVSLAQHGATGAVCAIKALSKAHIVKNQQVGPLHAGPCGGSRRSGWLPPTVSGA